MSLKLSNYFHHRTHSDWFFVSSCNVRRSRNGKLLWVQHFASSRQSEENTTTTIRPSLSFLFLVVVVLVDAFVSLIWDLRSYTMIIIRLLAYENEAVTIYGGCLLPPTHLQEIITAPFKPAKLLRRWKTRRLQSPWPWQERKSFDIKLEFVFLHVRRCVIYCLWYVLRSSWGEAMLCYSFSIAIRLRLPRDGMLLTYYLYVVYHHFFLDWLSWMKHVFFGSPNAPLCWSFHFTLLRPFNVPPPPAPPALSLTLSFSHGIDPYYFFLFFVYCPFLFCYRKLITFAWWYFGWVSHDDDDTEGEVK